MPTLIPRDIRARKIEPLAEKDPTQHQLGNKRSNNRERRPFITLENPVEKMTDEQNESDEERRDVAIVETKPALRTGTFKWPLCDR